jgi:hypothetical protein
MATRSAPLGDHRRRSTPDQGLGRGSAPRGGMRRRTLQPSAGRGTVIAWLLGAVLVVGTGWSGYAAGLRADEPAGQPEDRQAESSGGQVQPGDEGQPEGYPLRPQTKDKPDKKLSTAELKRLAAQGRVRKVVDQRFRRQPRASNRFERVKPDDYFVAAKLEMPLDVGRLDVRFEILPGLEPSVQQVSDYLFTTPERTVRDFMVVARFETLAEAEEGLAAARKQYDDAVAYQQQLIAYLQAQQQVQVSSVRRC